jgi:hypothetical protein
MDMSEPARKPTEDEAWHERRRQMIRVVEPPIDFEAARRRLLEKTRDTRDP